MAWRHKTRIRPHNLRFVSSWNIPYINHTFIERDETGGILTVYRTLIAASQLVPFVFRGSTGGRGGVTIEYNAPNKASYIRSIVPCSPVPLDEPSLFTPALRIVYHMSPGNNGPVRGRELRVPGVKPSWPRPQPVPIHPVVSSAPGPGAARSDLLRTQRRWPHLYWMSHLCPWAQ